MHIGMPAGYDFFYRRRVFDTLFRGVVPSVARPALPREELRQKLISMLQAKVRRGNGPRPCVYAEVGVGVGVGGGGWGVGGGGWGWGG